MGQVDPSRCLGPADVSNSDLSIRNHNLNSLLSPNDPPVEPPMVSVIVPARNEKADIEACLKSIASLDYPLEIIAIDDRSTDRTGDIINQMAQQHERIKSLALDETRAKLKPPLNSNSLKTLTIKLTGRANSGEWKPRFFELIIAFQAAFYALAL